MSKPLSKDAFAIMATCPYTGKQYGITVDKVSKKEEIEDVKGVEMADIGSQSYADEFE